MTPALAVPSRSTPPGWKRSWTLLVSLAVHAGLFAAVMWAGRTPPVHKATQVAVVQRKPKPKPEEKHEDEKPKPPPPQPVVQPKAIAAPAPVAPAPVAPVAAAPVAHVASGLTMSNGPGGGGGLAVGGLGKAATPAAAQAAPQPDKQTRAPAPVPKEDACDAPDTKPKPLGSTQVDYPDKARAEGVEGRIQVRLKIGEDGAVIDVELVQGIEASLDAVVLSVLRTWKFQPATHCGKPAPGVLAWAQRFELGD
jgi:protein TonB